ncbi:hypothetical protein DXA21_23180, partial [Parabacteroides distasonis]
FRGLYSCRLENDFSMTNLTEASLIQTSGHTMKDSSSKKMILIQPDSSSKKMILIQPDGEIRN